MDDTKRVLVVEDKSSLRSAMQRFLEADGYQVSTAGNGVQALHVMEQVLPDIIVADIMMPDMDGYDFYRAVRERAEWTAIPFIFLTARAQHADVIKGKALGVEDYLTKPVDPEELLVTIQARLARAREIQTNAEERLEEIKGQIVNALGHEMRTPLTYISGYTELALEDISSLSPDLLDEFLQGISMGAERLTRLANDFLILVRLDTGQTEEEFQRLVEVRHDLNAILERTVRQYEAQASAKGITLTTQVAPNLPPVRVCQPLLTDALGRLLDNAIKFSTEEGQAVTVRVQATEEWVAITVTDEGVGIPAHEIPHIFERFRQIDRKTMEQQGVGLGLPIAQGLIDLHGGEIEVQSAPEEGSTFTIKLPSVEVAGRTEDGTK